MDNIGKRMMEKWGWSKGQGLGKDNNGMTSCLILRKDAGSTTQGRIEHATPVVHDGASASVQAMPVQTQAVFTDPGEAAAAELAAAAAASLLSSLGAELGVGLPETEDAKRRRTKWDGTDSTNFVPGVAMNQPILGLQNNMQIPAMGLGASSLGATGLPSAASGGGFGFGNTLPKQRTVYSWPRHVDDWRWSKATEALYSFEEVALPGHSIPMARKLLSEGSRLPAKIADATDCHIELTAWSTLLLRPKGTGANIARAKQMLFQVFHPAAGSKLREEIFAEAGDEAEIDTSLGDAVGPTGIIDENAEKELAKKKKSRIGLGLKVDAGEDDPTNEFAEPLQSVDINLPTAEDVAMIRKYLEDLRLSTGAAPILSGACLKIFGRGKKLDRALQLVQTLLETGEWVAFSEAFVLSEETKEKRRAEEGPSEQLLIKIPEGPAVQVVERMLGSMEKAADADQLKLTTKPIAGKRTLMIEGTKKAHERVKLMVKELIENGESPMLTKFLNGSKVGIRSNVVKAFSEVAVIRNSAAAQSSTAQSTAPVSVSSSTADGVISAPPVLIPQPEPEKPPPAPKAPLPQLGAGFRLMAPPARKPAAAPSSKPAASGEASAGGLFDGLPTSDSLQDTADAEAEEVDGITE